MEESARITATAKEYRVRSHAMVILAWSMKGLVSRTKLLEGGNSYLVAG